MRHFDFKSEYSRLLTPEIVALLAQIHEYKGRQELFMEANDEAMAELLETAKVQSVEASSRIAGIAVSEDRLKKIVHDKTTPRSREEYEIAGYRDVLSTIQDSYAFIPVQPGMILQLHRDLYKFCGSSAGGAFKDLDTADAQLSWFQPVPATFVAETMASLCTSLGEALDSEEMDPLLLIPMFILDFLCIHPFNAGSGRMSRLLALLVLSRTGYTVGKYISIEKMIADSGDTYYEALKKSSLCWHENANDYMPFVRYLLGIIADAYREFYSQAELLTDRGFYKADRVREIIRQSTGDITKAEVMAQCPDISQTTVQRALKDLLKSNEIIKISGGRYASYIWNENSK